ncbi:hypothetical protein MLD38_032626 [Melastoma candidum]|uniref:Uncharacterized protein n=1 Tax=Melastoma candidum TaxID=119954 RepID=A0ACB9M3Z6_9MYRT|nr:hypothetical protein MLD38_032626 [Melastoma candidum]
MEASSLKRSLTREEGHFALPLTRNEAPVSETNNSISFEKDFVAEGNFADYSSACTGAQVSSAKHKVGEGLLGQVVYTNCPCVISLDNDAASRSMEVPFAQRGVSLPFHSTKTSQLVPADSHGVLQLGSFEEVAGDAAISARVRENFLAQYSNYSQHGLVAQTVPFPVEVTYDPLPLGIREVNPGYKITMSQLDKSEEASLYEILPFPNDLMDPDTGNSVEDINFWISCLKEQCPTFGACGSANSNDSTCAGQRPCDNGILKKDSGNDVCSPISIGVIGDTFSFPPGCELHKALGPAFMKQELNTVSESFASSGNLSSISDLHGKMNVLSESNKLTPCVLREKAEAFLGTMVTSLSEMPGASSVSNLYDVKTSIPLLTQIPVVSPAYGNSNASSFVQVDSLSEHNATEASDNGHNSFGQSSGHSIKNLMSMLIDKELDNLPLPHVPMRRWNKQSTGSRKRGRAWENQRPRPRDRQLIQERLKELRELVPKGAKCSIDSLLDQAIKHMNFLGRVIKQAEKLAKIATLKETGHNSDSSDDDSHQAMVFEGKIETFPIAIEDLSQPGHMLIKMKCSEHGLFLQMAQVISRLPLTILKGLLEIHSNDMWACFIVEVTEGFHKMDIFWSLMQLRRHVKGPLPSKV